MSITLPPKTLDVKDSTELRELAAKHWDVTVVGGGLAGTECALQLASFGIRVGLIEMRPKEMTPAHKTSSLAELVCSNSFGNQTQGTAPEQLKWEAKKLNSFVLSAATTHAVPAGQALAVDRDKFSSHLSLLVRNSPLIQLISFEVKDLDSLPRPTVVATGPLTSPSLGQSLQNHFGSDFLYFFDAIAPIISTDSINFNRAWKQSRYDKGGQDYINCPLNKEEYFNLIKEIENAKKIEPKEFDKTPFFEGCMPIEEMVRRGHQTLRFGPLKPVGLKPPTAEREPFAVVQLRQDNTEGTAFNMVGFQTRMTYSEQVRVFKLIPGLENAEFLKLGSIHRNLFINTPQVLNSNLSSKKDPSLFFAGQITGVEGYFESTCIGLLVAYFVKAHLQNLDLTPPPRASAIGSLLNALLDPQKASHFQPTNINFGLFPEIPKGSDKKIPKDKKRGLQIEKAKLDFENWEEFKKITNHTLKEPTEINLIP